MTSMNKATFHTTDSVNLVHSNIIDGCMCERIKKKKEDIYKKKKPDKGKRDPCIKPRVHVSAKRKKEDKVLS